MLNELLNQCLKFSNLYFGIILDKRNFNLSNLDNFWNSLLFWHYEPTQCSISLKNIFINSKINWLKSILIFKNSFRRIKILLHNYRFNLKSWKFFQGLILKNLKFSLCKSVFHFIWPMFCFVLTPHLPHLILPWLWS